MCSSDLFPSHDNKGESDTNNGETANNAETNSNEGKTGKTSTKTSTHSDARLTKSHNQSIKAGSTNDTSASSPNAYKVKRGETIFQLAKRYHCSVRDLKKWNRLRSCKLRPGQQLIIKNGQNSQIQESEKAKAKEQAIEEERKKIDNGNTHTVQTGETLAAIGRIYKCSTAELIKWNHLRNAKIRVGQIIKIRPGNAEYVATRTYSKKKGESDTNNGETAMLSK